MMSERNLHDRRYPPKTRMRIPHVFQIWFLVSCSFGVAMNVSRLQAAHIHVSPTGNDANPGNQTLPMATPAAARNKVRQMVANGLKEKVEIIFAAGCYELAGPLALLPEDSGTEEFPITWKALPGAKVIWSGGLAIPRRWEKQADGIWQVDLAGIGPKDWNPRLLFVNEKAATRARFPNADAAQPFLYATGGDFDHVMIAPEYIKESWGRARDAQINIVPHWKFFNQWNTLTKVDPKSGRIDIADSERHGKILPGNWFWIEGVREELDQPGEWFFDIGKRTLSYMPEPGVDPNTLAIVAPVADRLVHAKGDVNAGTHVRNIHFEGIEFRHTSFTLGHIEARVHTDAAVMFENTLDCSVRNCRFENIGGYAFWLHLDSRRNIFDRNIVMNSGGGGVLMTGARLSYMDESRIYTPGDAAAKVFPILNEVTRNRVEHCGKIRYYGGGVHLDSRPFAMSMEPGNLIAHNDFNDLSRNGVFAFRNQGGNVVEYNHIHNAMQTTIDGGCIHFATMNHLNAPNFILNNWLYDIWGYEQRPVEGPKRHLANGIFLDWDTSNTTVRDNWVYNPAGEAIKKVWQNENLDIRDNQVSPTRIVPPFLNDLGPDGDASHHIDLASNRLVGSVIHYSDSAHVTTKGTWKPQTATGMWGLFTFKFLVGTADDPAEAIYSLPIPEDGTYRICLLYQPGDDCATNAPVTIDHADGTTEMTWNMRNGSKHGFAVTIGTYRFKADGKHAVRLSTEGTNGKVIADAVAFVKVAD